MESISKLLSLTTFAVSFPHIFSSVGKAEGLKISLSLFIMYIIRGMCHILLHAISEVSLAKTNRRPTPQLMLFLSRAGSIFVFSEVPFALFSAYIGLKYISVGWTVIYEHFLCLICPLFILVEGFSAMTIILSSGQLWSDALSEQSFVIKGLVLAGCLSLYLVSGGIIGHFYYEGMIRTVLGATLVAVVATLIVILTTVTIIISHGTITDTALLSVYLTYNIWIVSRAVPSITLHSQGPSSLFRMLTQAATAKNIPSIPLLETIESIIALFSVEVVTTLLVQMAIFLLAITLYRKSVLDEREEERGKDQMVADLGWISWLLTVIWPSFGRSVLVAVYTYSWLLASQKSPLPVYLDPILWRWLNVFMCLLIYCYHLLSNPDQSDEFHIKFD